MTSRAAHRHPPRSCICTVSEGRFGCLLDERSELSPSLPDWSSYSLVRSAQYAGRRRWWWTARTSTSTSVARYTTTYGKPFVGTIRSSTEPVSSTRVGTPASGHLAAASTAALIVATKRSPTPALRFSTKAVRPPPQLSPAGGTKPGASPPATSFSDLLEHVVPAVNRRFARVDLSRAARRLLGPDASQLVIVVFNRAVVEAVQKIDDQAGPLRLWQCKGLGPQLFNTRTHGTRLQGARSDRGEEPGDRPSEASTRNRTPSGGDHDCVVGLRRCVGEACRDVLDHEVGRVLENLALAGSGGE